VDIYKNIDKSETRNKAIRILEQARFARIMGYAEREPSITMNYEPRYHKGPVGAVSKDTEKSAIHNVELREILQKVYRALIVLDDDEREIIRRYYLEPVRVSDMVVRGELHLTHSTYYRAKRRALLKIAQALGVVVFKQNTERKDEHA
jgi:ArpU family phage transcriptional regulator